MKNLLVSALVVFGVSFGGSVMAQPTNDYRKYCENSVGLMDCSLIKDIVDKESFVAIENRLYKDKNNIYYTFGDGRPFLLNAKINEKEPRIRFVNSHYLAVNEKYLYYRNNFDGFIKLENLNIDVKTFDILGSYAKDKNFIYNSKLEIIKNADSNTFEILNYDNSVPYYYSDFFYTLARDENYIYSNGKVVDDIDANSFVVVGGIYTKDKNGIFLVGHKSISRLEGDVENFKYLGDQYAKNDKYIYFEGEIIQGADVSTFEVLSYWLSKDKNNYYNWGKLIDYKDIDFYEKFIFDDIEIKNILASAIIFVRNKNFVKGYDDNTYRPENPITRAEFTKIILLAKYSQEEIDETKIQYFSDVKKSDWFANYVNFAKSKNIISGVAETVNFEPNENINFAEASKIIVNVLLGEQTELETSENWYDIYLEKLSENNINLENFDVNKNVTRGEMAELIYGLKDFVK